MTQNPIKSLAGQTAVYGMGTIIPRLLNYLLVPVYTRVFVDQALYGQITELYAYIAFLMVLLTYGMETAFFRYAQKHDHQKVFNQAMSSILLTTSIFVLLVFVFNNQIAAWLNYEGNGIYILMAALIVAFDAITAIPFAFLRKQNKARKFAVIRLVNVIFTILLNFITVIWFPKDFLMFAKEIFGPDTNLVAGVFLSNLMASGLSLIMLAGVFNKFRFSVEAGFLKPMLSYAWPVLVIGLAGMVNEMLDKILLKYLLPADENPLAQLGIYGANYKLGVLMTLFIQMFRYAAEPFFFAEAEKKNAPALFARIMNYFVIAGLIIFLVVSLYIDLFKLFIGTQYRDGLQIVPIILMANLFNGIYYNLAVWYKLTDRTLSGAIIAVGGAMLTIVLLIVVIPAYGYIGAAWVTLIVYFLMTLLSYIWGQKVFFIPYQFLKILTYIVIAVSIYLFINWIKVENLVLKYFISAVAIALFAYFSFRSETKSQKQHEANV